MTALGRGEKVGAIWDERKEMAVPGRGNAMSKGPHTPGITWLLLRFKPLEVPEMSGVAWREAEESFGQPSYYGSLVGAP